MEDMQKFSAIITEINKIAVEASDAAALGNGAAHIAYVRLVRLASFVSSIAGVNSEHPSIVYPKAWPFFLADARINAIKEVRFQTGLGLKEAKDIVDSWEKFNV